MSTVSIMTTVRAMTMFSSMPPPPNKSNTFLDSKNKNHTIVPDKSNNNNIKIAKSRHENYNDGTITKTRSQPAKETTQETSSTATTSRTKEITTIKPRRPSRSKAAIAAREREKELNRRKEEERVTALLNIGTFSPDDVALMSHAFTLGFERGATAGAASGSGGSSSANVTSVKGGEQQRMKQQQRSRRRGAAIAATSLFGDCQGHAIMEEESLSLQWDFSGANDGHDEVDSDNDRFCVNIASRSRYCKYRHLPPLFVDDQHRLQGDGDEEDEVIFDFCAQVSLRASTTAAATKKEEEENISMITDDDSTVTDLDDSDFDFI